jgi:hypothetical protein
MDEKDFAARAFARGQCGFQAIASTKLEIFMEQSTTFSHFSPLFSIETHKFVRHCFPKQE